MMSCMQTRPIRSGPASFCCSPSEVFRVLENDFGRAIATHDDIYLSCFGIVHGDTLEVVYACRCIGVVVNGHIAYAEQIKVCRQLDARVRVLDVVPVAVVFAEHRDEKHASGE